MSSVARTFVLSGERLTSLASTMKTLCLRCQMIEVVDLTQSTVGEM